MVDQSPLPVELEGYEAIEPLGGSSTATLVRARPEGSTTSVVIKLLKSEYPTPEEVARLTHEHRIVEDLHLDGVVRPLRIERFKHRVGLIFEDSGGSSLRSMIGPTGLDTETFLRVAIPLVRTLGHLHEADVIHKDLNPSNIVVDDTLSTVQITDFGIASRLPRVVHRDAGPADRLEGTLPYLAPEQTGRMNRAVDHRSDFYALGATFYEALTGQPPFTATDAMELVHCHLAVRPVPPREVNPAVPEALADIVMKLLAKSPEDRYQSAYGLLRDLEACQVAWREHQHIDGFRLGRHDVASRFSIPDRLYGREAETGELLASLNRVTDGSAELVLLVGGSGVGKSVLVQEIQGPTVERHGHFIRGKFDQYSASAPYASLIDAVRQLVHQLLGEPPERIAAWRDAILAALAGNAAVVGDVIPDVTRITGPLPPVAELGPTETQNRFNVVFRRFIRTLARPEHPLVVFLDDLHWADVASVRLLRTLVSDPDARHLLIIGAYRPEAVDPSGPLATAIADLDPSSVRHIELGPLGLDTVTELVADTVRAARDEAAPLARLVHERTAGNPFFVNQFLRSLFEDGLLRFAADSGRWDWNLAGIRGTRHDRQRRRPPRRPGRRTGRGDAGGAPHCRRHRQHLRSRHLGAGAGSRAEHDRPSARRGYPGGVRAPTRRRSRAHDGRLRGPRPLAHHLPLPPRPGPAGLLLTALPRRGDHHPSTGRPAAPRALSEQRQGRGPLRRRRAPERRHRAPRPIPRTVWNWPISTSRQPAKPRRRTPTKQPRTTSMPACGCCPRIPGTTTMTSPSDSGSSRPRSSPSWATGPRPRERSTSCSPGRATRSTGRSPATSTRRPCTASVVQPRDTPRLVPGWSTSGCAGRPHRKRRPKRLPPWWRGCSIQRSSNVSSACPRATNRPCSWDGSSFGRGSAPSSPGPLMSPLWSGRTSRRCCGAG